VRYRCSGSVEFRSEGSDARFVGHPDRSQPHGCYVEMSTNFSGRGRGVDLTLESMGIRMRVQGTVRGLLSVPWEGDHVYEHGSGNANPKLGQVLSRAGWTKFRWLRPIPPGRGPNTVESTLSAAVMGADPSAVLDQVRQFLRRQTGYSPGRVPSDCKAGSPPLRSTPLPR